MRTFAKRPAAAPRSAGPVESVAQRTAAPQSLSAQATAAELGHRFENLAVDRAPKRSRHAQPVMQLMRRGFVAPGNDSESDDEGERQHLLPPPLLHQPPLFQQQPLPPPPPPQQLLPPPPPPLQQQGQQQPPPPPPPPPLLQQQGQQQPPPQQQPPSYWSRFKGWLGRSLESRTANFIGINSPGTQTGAVGGVSGVNSLLAPPSQIPRVQSSGYSAATGKYTTGVGGGLNILAGGSDLLATAQGLNSMSKEGGIRGFFRGIRDTFSRRNNETGQQAETRSTAKRLAVDTPVNLADASSQGMQAGNAISSLTHAGTSILPAATGLATAGIGAGVQTIVAGRAGYRAFRAHKHKQEVDRLINAGGMSPNMTAAANHMSQQLAKRRKRNILGGIGAGVGAVGGGLLLGGLLGASMLTPIGWALAGASVLGAAGLGAYKLYRHFKKKNAPAGQRLGEERGRHAANLHAAVSDPMHPDHAHALQILASHGVTRDQASDPQRGEQLIRRKLEGW